MTQQLANLQFIALDLMTYHGLRQAGWKFAWTTSKRTAGLCTYGTRTLSFSQHFANAGTEDDFRDTILHEIAHALVGVSHGHDHVWKAKAISIGCNGSRTTDIALPLELSNWVGECALGHQSGMQRKPKYIDHPNSYICGKCKKVAKVYVVKWYNKGSLYKDWTLENVTA